MGNSVSDSRLGGCLQAEMSATHDAQLLEEWARQGTEEAFTELVHRHLPLVWGTARRITGDPDLARDIAQSVFSDLATKARVLPERIFLPGWLHRAAVHAASKQVRGNARRKAREAIAMQDTEFPPGSSETEAATRLQPLLDEALAALPESDRDALLMRYFNNKSYGDIGAALGASDDTVQKRVSRAVEKMRDHFRARGVVVGAGAVAASLGLAASSPAPVGLATGISAALVGTPLSSPTVSLLPMKLLVTALAVATGTLTVIGVRQHQQLDALTAAHAGLQQQLAQATSSRNSPPPAAELSADLLNELLRLRAESAQRQRESPRKQAGKVAQLEATVAEQAAQLAVQEAELKFQSQIASRINALKILGLAARIYAADHQDHLPTTLEAMRQEMSLNDKGQFPGGLSPDDFEFYPQPRPIAETEPHLILFREKRPLVHPDGTEVRVFCLADGSVQQVREDRLAEFEREGTATGEAPAAPAAPDDANPAP